MKCHEKEVSREATRLFPEDHFDAEIQLGFARSWLVGFVLVCESQSNDVFSHDLVVVGNYISLNLLISKEVILQLTFLRTKFEA